MPALINPDDLTDTEIMALMMTKLGVEYSPAIQALLKDGRISDAEVKALTRQVADRIYTMMRQPQILTKRNHFPSTAGVPMMDADLIQTFGQ